MLSADDGVFSPSPHRAEVPMPTKIPYHRPASASIPYAKTAERVERDRFYYSPRWKALRDRFLAMSPENRLCARCRAEGRTALAEVVHHVKERLAFPELAYRLDNLEGVCKPCHNRIHKTGRRGG